MGRVGFSFKHFDPLFESQFINKVEFLLCTRSSGTSGVWGVEARRGGTLFLYTLYINPAHRPKTLLPQKSRNSTEVTVTVKYTWWWIQDREERKERKIC